MADPRGFLKHDRELPSHRPVPVRLRDWKEVYEDFPEDKIRTQASRCMDCGIPFCNNGCPLGNIIPDWNDLTYRGLWHDAIDRLHATNNFPEFTGRLCPAPCESACVLAFTSRPSRSNGSRSRSSTALAEGWVVPMPAATKTGKKVAVVGSALPDLRSPSSSPAPGTMWSSTSALIASVVCCATASPNSRWRSVTSTVASSKWRPRGRCSAPT